MKKESKKKREQDSNTDTNTTQTKRKISKTMEAALRLQGCITVLDPSFLE